MNRHDFITRLVELPRQIGQAEAELLAAEWQKTMATEGLQQREDELIVAGVEGKNSEQRAALVRQGTAEERQVLLSCEQTAQQLRSRLRILNTELAALKAVARLIGGTE